MNFYEDTGFCPPSLVLISLEEVISSGPVLRGQMITAIYMWACEFWIQFRVHPDRSLRFIPSLLQIQLIPFPSTVLHSWHFPCKPTLLELQPPDRQTTCWSCGEWGNLQSFVVVIKWINPFRLVSAISPICLLLHHQPATVQAPQDTHTHTHKKPTLGIRNVYMSMWANLSPMTYCTVYVCVTI